MVKGWTVEDFVLFSAVMDLLRCGGLLWATLLNHDSISQTEGLRTDSSLQVECNNGATFTIVRQVVDPTLDQ